MQIFILFQTPKPRKIYLLHDSCKILFCFKHQSLEKYIYCMIHAKFYFVSNTKASKNIFTALFMQKFILFQTPKPRKIYLLHDSCKILFCFKHQSLEKYIYCMIHAKFYFVSNTKASKNIFTA